MARKSKVSLTKRRDAVLKALRREEPLAKIARRLGVSTQSLDRWVKAFQEAGEQGLRDKRRANDERTRIKELEKELAKRDQIIGELTVANRILKKTSEL